MTEKIKSKNIEQLMAEDDEIVGLLRFSDVFRKASETMKECSSA